VILREAGGRITDFRGFDHSIYGQEMVASNGRIHSAMLEVLALKT
jgi:myo-inositol-1(or 4)-monophosphatase